MQSRRRWSRPLGDAPRCLTRRCFAGADSFLSSAVVFRPALPGTRPPLPVPPPTQNPVQPPRPVQAVWTGHVGQPLHSHRGVLWRTPGLAELPLWRHLHPSAVLARIVAHAHAHALAKLHHHTSPWGQKRLQGPGYFHLPEAVLTVPAHVRTANMGIYLGSPPPPPPPLSPFLRIRVSLSCVAAWNTGFYQNLWPHTHARLHAGENTGGGTIVGRLAGLRVLPSASKQAAHVSDKPGIYSAGPEPFQYQKHLKSHHKASELRNVYIL